MAIARTLQTWFGWTLLIAVCWASEVRAHATGENYVWLNVADVQLKGHFEIRLEDLRTKLGIPMPTDPEEARERINETAPEVWAYLEDHFSIEASGEEIPWTPLSADLLELEGLGHFARYFYETPEIAVPDQITVRNDIFHEHDRFHRGLLLIESNAKTGEEYGEEFTVLVFSPSNPEQLLDLTAVETILQPRDFVWQGMLHIWLGYDHVLFLLTLLLPAVLVYRQSENGGAWARMPSFGSACWNMFKIVTIFTIAHSITLTLAALDIVRLPSRFVESTIALSIIVVAISNLYPRSRPTTWVVIFLFGLFHGLGFASVMGDLPFRMGSLIKVILGFNIGVELGQIVIVAAIFPLLFWLSRSPLYARNVMVGGSVVIGLLATYWFVERATGMSL